ncbi:uncharacterized protein LOC122089608 [Macadamia integrifolia]|uniref:uncharacterized protein LOC122089608 n=1 Tax=Macadamia integrifolia TaxID=60698 RepID=UPI001C4E95A9|nr:uncharacterized protein LOC122089608 [Macadamia integrifolia]
MDKQIVAIPHLFKALMAAILGPNTGLFETMIDDIMSTGNEWRSHAERLYLLCCNYDNHHDRLCVKLDRLLESSPDVELRAMYALPLQKQFTEGDCCFIQKELSADTQSNIKSVLLCCIFKERNRKMLKILSDTVAVLGSTILLGGGWPDQLPFIFTFLNSHSSQRQEFALLIFSDLFKFFPETLNLMLYMVVALFPHHTTVDEILNRFFLDTSKSYEICLAAVAIHCNVYAFT